MRILVIEDEKKTAAFLAKGMGEAGFAVDLARDGERGLELARTTKFDLLIVDIMLPTKTVGRWSRNCAAAECARPFFFLPHETVCTNG